MPEIKIKELKQNIKSRDFSRVYLLYGEENYLKEYYLSRIIDAAVGDTFPEFNIKTFCETLPLIDFSEAVDSFPMMCDKSVVVVRDFDIFKANEGLKVDLSKLLSSAPEHCVIIFYYGKADFAPDRRTKLFKELSKVGRIICFKHAQKSELLSWIKRRFAAHDRTIDTELCEHLVFLCGDLMQGLIPEIEKIAAYSRRKEVTQADIEAVATPNPSAIIFALTDALAERNFNRAISISEELKESGENEIPMLAMIAKQFRQLYFAKLSGSTDELMRFWGITNFYRAKKIVSSSCSMRLDWLRYAVEQCANTDLNLKSGSTEGEIETMIARLAVYSGGGDVEN